MTFFIREDWTLFRSLETLAQKAGVRQDNLGAVVAKELVDNALDAAEGRENAVVNIGYLDNGGFFVEDNGDGIPPHLLPELFSIRRPLTSSKLLRLPTRGALGNGLRVVTGAVLASGGSLRVFTCGQAIQLMPQEDGQTIAEIIGDYDKPGLRVEIHLGANLVNRSTLNWANNATFFNHGAGYKGKTSPYWYNGDAFFELVQAAGARYIRDLLTDFDGCTGAKAGQITDGFQGRTCDSLTRDEAEALLKRARQHTKPVKAERLGKIGDTLWQAASYCCESGHILINPRGKGDFAEIPHIIEAWVIPSDESSFGVNVNKTPITSSAWAETTKGELTLVASGYKIGQFKVGRSHYNVWLNIQTPHMPITSDGKSPDVSEFSETINTTIDRAIKKAKRLSSNSRSISAPVSQKETIFINLEEAVQQASGNGQYRFSIRQLFYAMRPKLMELVDTPSYQTFTACITDYERIHENISGMYRDPRGMLYHPHTGEEFPLGTLEVEEYTRPEWTFNKILYSEKEGFFSILKAERWAEKHDCALLSSKGQASRAAKDLLDLLGDTDEEIHFFCIHDADAAGTMIYQSLQDETKGRRARKVHIHNLGLEAWEAQEMGLQIENPQYGSHQQPVADYVPAKWAEWLQSNRVELNAMTSQVFIEWLDAKIEAYGIGKVTPPLSVTEKELNDNVIANLKRSISDRILKEANVDRQVAEAFAGLKEEYQTAAIGLSQTIESDLYVEPEKNWRLVVKDVASELAPDTQG